MGPCSYRSKNILAKWETLFKENLPNQRWALKGSYCLGYIPQGDRAFSLTILYADIFMLMPYCLYISRSYFSRGITDCLRTGYDTDPIHLLANVSELLLIWYMIWNML